MAKRRQQSGYVFKRKGSPFWYARWWVKGKEHVASTQERTKDEAEAEKDRLVARSKGEYDIEDAFQVLLEMLSRVEDLDEREKRRRALARRLASGAKDKLSLRTGWQAWLDSPNKKRTPKASTLAGHEAIWNRWDAWAKGHSPDYFHEVDRSHAEQYAGDLWKSHVAPSTFNAHINLLSELANGATRTSGDWLRERSAGGA